MIITFVTDCYFDENNGTGISARRFTELFRKRGHEVRVVTIDDQGRTQYALEKRSFGKPIDAVFELEGFRLAKPDENILKKAIIGSDIVHVYMPFKLGIKAVKLCRQLNIPCTAAFHVDPCNITTTTYMSWIKPINDAIYQTYYSNLYRYVKHIHCPSLMIAQRLVKQKYHNYLHVISNGFSQIFEVEKTEKPKFLDDKIIVSFIGRFSKEKRHDLIIKAVNISKYRDKIQLIFGGRGPTKKKIERMAGCLPNTPIFGFYNKEQLKSIHNFTDIYIHPADTEIEGISCIEAIACGVVPIVSNSSRSATPQFTICEESLFKRGDYKDLAKKLDWWIEHPEKRQEYKKNYIEHSKKFLIENSIDQTIEMFKQAIKDWDPNFDGKKAQYKMEPTIINKPFLVKQEKTDITEPKSTEEVETLQEERKNG